MTFFGNVIDKRSYKEYSKEFQSKFKLKEIPRQYEDGTEYLRKNKSRYWSEKTVGGLIYSFGLLIYSLVRDREPKRFVETGVRDGISSFFILSALEENNFGKLYSIDYPIYFAKNGSCSIEFFENNFEYVIQNQDKFFDCKTGFVVPNYLDDRWEITYGKSQNKLKPLLQNLNEIDFFLHDSDHSYDCMSYEYDISSEYVKDGGIVFSDDINHNNAFRYFVDENNFPNWRFCYNRCGVFVRR